MNGDLAYYFSESQEFSKDNLVVCDIQNKKIHIIGNVVSLIEEGSSTKLELEVEDAIRRISEANPDYDVNKFYDMLIKHGKYIKVEFKIKDKNGNNLFLSMGLKPLFDKEGNLETYFGLFHDITEQKKYEEKLQNIIDFDSITKLPSKYYTKEKIDEHLEQCQKHKSRGALIIVNIDNFKLVNDTYGHENGDILLKKVSVAIKKQLGKRDILCRYSGDVFIIFRRDISSLNEIEKITDKIKSVFVPPFTVSGDKIFITSSIGVAISPDNGNNFNVLFKNADTAIYRAKTNGKDTVEIFNNSISTELNRVYEIEKGLRTSLEDNELYVVFQPKVALEDSRVNGFEALLRWNSKVLGQVSPVEFIPIAESTRQIVPIGKFVLEQVFKYVKMLLEDGQKDFKCAVNFSEVQFRYGTIIEDFKEFINKYDVSPEYIEVEITESVLMKTSDDNLLELKKLKDIGLTVALDDFGTGYSSLNYLTKMPIDVLKIDRSFIIDILTNPKSKCIVEKIISLSHEFGIYVVAEGVEDIEQVEILKEIFCDVVQGYYFSKPELFTTVRSMLGKRL